MKGLELIAWEALLAPHVVSVALCGARLIPVALLCPLLGGITAPASVRLGVALSFSLAVHFAGGLTVSPVPTSVWVIAGWILKELCLGLSIGLIASLPFDAARTGGRFIDLFRGTSAEAALPVVGTKESATGDALYQTLLALVVSSAAFPLVIGGLWKSFVWIQLGTSGSSSEGAALQVVALAGVALATGLAIGAPIAALSLVIDLTLGLIARVSPQLGFKELSAPARILGGGAVLWLSVGLVCDRLLGGVEGSADALASFLRTAR